MPGMEENSIAITNRSLRNIRTELEFLTDLSIISPQQLSSIISQLPSQSPVHAPLLSASITNGTPALSTAQAPVSEFTNTSLNEKQNGFYIPSQLPVPPPPAYASNASGPPPLATATALYAYQPTDAGDLALMPHDHIAVSEWMNADWAKGRNQRTGQEGIFPRSYVNVLDKQPPNSGPTNYGNMPLDVSQSGASPAEPGQPSKINEQGKKFGKKMGNAAIFGAGATIGSNIVNSIF
ncbi:MAG: hypothetical protein M1830_000172 [Pleopsidium flavum]|nr:MAG: hypothetical protein M1830_000172 [Pleopsidium flavum]